MVGRSKPMNKVEKDRAEFCKFYMCCLPCILVGLLNSHGGNDPKGGCEYHHVVEGFKRLGHLVGYSQCNWHHKGEPFPGLRMIDCTMAYGDSLAHGKKPFEKTFGDELLLVKTTDFAYTLFKKNPWNEFSMPESIGEEIRKFHERLESKGAAHVVNFSDDWRISWLVV